MGFDTSTVTQDRDNMDGYFGITTHHSIPVLQYGDSFTWENSVTWFYILI
jgi:hypothetical protein